MQRALGALASGSNPLQPTRRRNSSWHLHEHSRSSQLSCHAASTLSNGEPEARSQTSGTTTPAAPTTPSSKTTATTTTAATVTPPSTPPAGSDATPRDQPPSPPPPPPAHAPSSPEAAASTAAPSGPQPPPFSPAFLRRLTTATSALDVAEALSDEAAAAAAAGGAGSGHSGLSEEDARALLAFCLQRGKVKLALALYGEMCTARRGGVAGGGGGSGSAGGGGGIAGRSLDVAYDWPTATLSTTRDLVLGLCQQLCIVEALQVISDLKLQGLPRGSEEVGFGKVVTSPLAPERPLTVVQPQEGSKTVADGFSRYEYEVFSGTAVSMSSTALEPPGGLLRGLGRALGLLRRPGVAAIHEFVLQAPDGTSRTFRVGTATAAVPAQVGERVTVVSAPTRNLRKGGLFNASPPGTKPGEALSATNHKTGAVLPLLRPPVSAEQAGALPSWVLPAAVVLAGGDAASALLDPALPLLIAAGAASLGGSAVLGSTLLVPRLKQLPDNAVRVEYVRQQLLAQYSSLADKAAVALTECGEDVRVLARLWQLQNKMEAVAAASSSSSSSSSLSSSSPSSSPANPASGAGGGLLAGVASALSGNGGSMGSSSGGGGGGSASTAAGGAAYEARISRVARARANIEERLGRRIELLEGYGRVMAMIEIEVEMEVAVPAAELAGIQQQVARLVELEALAEDWRAQAEARDEVERLLRAA